MSKLMMSLTRKRKLGSPERLQIGSKASKQEEWMSPPTSHNAPQSKPQVTPPCTPEKSQVCPTLLEPMAKGKDQGVVPETLSPRRQSPRSKGQSQTPHKDPKTTVSSEDPTQCHSPTEHPSPAEEDTELDLVITLDEQEGGGRRGRRKAAVKRKRGAGGEGVPPDCEFEVDGQLDRELESKSKQHNLTTVNVRNIIHEVITNEHVVAMMKAAISETQDMPMFEPKMTRSKLKEVVEKGVVIPTWNISPIKKAKEVKPPQFVDIPLDEEDSSDEEYCPDEDEEDETAEETFLESDVESTASSPRGSRLGRPRTPLDTSEGDEERSSSPTQGLSPPGPNQQRHLRVEVVPMGPPPPPKAPGGPSWPQQPDFSFMEKLHAVEEELEQSPVCMDSYQSLGDNLVACRTRSKRPLKDVPLGLLEAELRAPDITPDMYEMGGQEDNEWQGWLRGLMTSEVENDEEGDDEDDPEYNFLDDIDEPDLEDYRNDRAVRITKKEVNELMEELFETFQDELGVPDQDDEGHDDEEEREEEVEQGTPKFNVPQAIRFEEPLANMLTERRRTVKEQLEALQQRRALQESRPEPPAPAPAGPHFLMLPSPTCTLLLNPTQKHQLQQQMQQHVQLLTQVHILTSTIPVLQSEAVTTRHFLTELQSFAQSTEETRGLVEPGFVSMFRACNLEGALSLLEEFDRTIKPQLTQASPQRPARQRCNTVVRPYPTMPPRLAWLLATRKEFLCPELLPICSLDPAQHPPRVKTIYTRGEDSLIALGLKHFADTEFPHQLVCRYLVRTKTAQQLRMHLREASHCRAPDNELKHFLLTRKVPPLLRACQRVLPTDSRPAVERELARMPAWLQKSLPIIHKAVLDYNSTLEGGEATPGESTPPYVFPPGTQYPPDLPADVTLRLNPYGVRTLKPHSRLWPHGRAKRLALSRPVVLPLDKTPMVLQMPLSTRPVNFNPTVTLTRISEKELEQNACKKASSSISKICPFLIPTLLPPVSSPCSAGGVMTGTAVAVQTPSTTVQLSVGAPCSAGGVKTGTVIAPQKPSTTVQLSVGAPCSAGGVKTSTVVAPQKPSTTVQLSVGAPCSAGGVKTGTVIAPQKPSTTVQLSVGPPCSAGGVKTSTVIAPQKPSTTVLLPAGAPCSLGGVKTGTVIAPQKPSTTVQLSVGPPCSAGGVKTSTVIAPQKPSTTVQLSVGAPCSAGGVKTGTVIAPQKPSTTVLLPAGAPCSLGGVKTGTVIAPQKPSTTVQLSVGAPCSAGGVKTGIVIAPQKPSTSVQLSVGAPCPVGGLKTGTVIAPQKPSTRVLWPAGAPYSTGGVKTGTVIAPQKPSTTVQLSVGAPCSAGGVKTGTVIAPQKPSTTEQLSVGPPCSAGGVKTGTVIAPQKPSTTVQLSVGTPCSAGGVKTGTVVVPQKPSTTEQLPAGAPCPVGGVKTGTAVAPQKPSTTVQLSVGTPCSTGGVKTGTVIAPQKPSTTVLWPAGALCSAGGVKTGTTVAPQKPSTTVQLSVGTPCSAGGVKTGTVIAPQKPSTTVQLSVGAPCSAGGVKTGTAAALQNLSTTVQLPVGAPCSAGGVKTGTVVAPQKPSTTVLLPAGAPCSAGGVKTSTVVAPQKPSTTEQLSVGTPCSAGGVKTGTAVAPQKPSTTEQLPAGAPCSAGGVKTGTAVAPQKPSTTEQLPAGAPCSAGGVKTGTVVAPQNPSTTVQLSVDAPCSAGGVITGTAVAAQTPLCTVQIPVSVPYKAKRAKKGAAVALQTSSTTLRFPVGASYGTGGVMTGMEGGAQTPSCTVQIPVSAPCQAGGAGTGMSVASATPGITVQLRAAPTVSFSRAMVAAGVNPSSQFLQIRPVSRSPSQLQAPLQPLLLTIPTGGSVSLYSLGGASVGGVGSGGAGGMLFPRAVGETGPRRVCRVLQPTVVIKLGTPLTTAVTAADRTSAETPPEPASQPQDPVTHPDGALAVLRKLVGVAPESGRSPTLKGDIPLQLRTSPLLQCSIPSPESRHPASINPTSLPSPAAPETSPGNLGTNTSEVEGAPQFSSKPPDVMGQERAGAMQDPHSCQVAIHIPVSTSAGGPPECMDSQSLKSSTLTHAEMAAPLKSAAPQCPEPQQPTAGTTEEMNPTGAVPHLSTNTADDTETCQKVWISTDTGAAQPLSQELQGCTVKSVPQNFSSIMDTKGTPQYSTVNAENKGVLPTPSSDIGTKEAPPGNSNTIFNKGTPTNSSELISTLGVRSETGDRGQGQTETPESQTFTSHNVGSCEGSGGVPQESSEAKDTTGSSCRVSGMHPSPFLCTPLGACLPEGEIEEVEEDREDLGQEEEHEEEMGSDFGEPLLALSESSGSPASSLDSQADALERLMEIEGEKEGRGNEEEREGGNLTCRDSVPQLQRGTEEEEEGGRGREEEMERGGLTCRDIVPQVERGTEKEEEEKGGKGSEEERERGGSTSRDGVPQLERGNTEGGGSSPQLERNEEERETEKERGASVCRDSVLSLRRDTEGEEEGGRTVSGHGSPQLENNEEEDGGGRPGPRRSETEGEEGERTGQEEDRARVNTTACQVEWGLQGEAGGGGLALSSGTESQGQPGQAGEGGGGGGGGGGGEQEGQRGGGADQVGEGESGGEGERDGGEGEKRGEGEGGEDESEKGDGDGERQGEGEEEEDFDDLTQDEDEEEVMSSASEESVLSVPELQETMEKLTWLASERRMCPEGDSEEDNSQNSQNSQEENSEEEEEVGPRKGEEAGDGDASKMIGQGAPQGAGPLETSDKCAGRGRGRGRTPSRSLRRSRRRERDSKDTSKLLLLYDDNILENDPMRESKDIAFAQAYLNRVREALQGYPGKVEEFLGVLYEFERGREQRSAVELFSQLRAVLTDWPDLLRDFAAFLLPEQALECGLFAEQQAFERSRRFLRQLEICFGENSSQYQKIVKALQVGPELSPAGVEELKVQMASLLKGHSHLEGEFWVFFDELRPPPSRPGQFEEAAWPEEGEGCAEGGFEEVTLPDLEEEEESHKIPPITGRGKRRKEMGSHGNEKECDWPEAAKDCPCPCHDSAHDAKLRRHKRKGCPHCHVAKGSSDSSRPSRNREPSEPGASSPGRASAEGRLGGGEEEGEGNSPPAGTALRSHTAGASDQQTSRSPTSVLLRSVSGPAGSGVRPWDCGEGGAPREEAEEGEAERDKDSGGGSPSPKKSRTDAGAAVATETEAWEEGGCRDPQGAPRTPLPCCSAPPHTQGEPLGGQSPSLSSTPLRMSSGSDSTVCAKNISLTPSGEKVILWNREADRVILTTCQQQGASQATFQAISAQLGNKTTSEVSRRFRDLMRLFHTAARQLSSEDEASAAEQQSATDEELD
ncbi:GON-4-like protein isoform X3 [Lepisosteus oculatus]|uniref:GON-4-like protein isoform X3 n=1 Tax=Lepisosteus oculatus TaxID=7918 RepID=UPI003721D0FF